MSANEKDTSKVKSAAKVAGGAALAAAGVPMLVLPGPGVAAIAAGAAIAGKGVTELIGKEIIDPSDPRVEKVAEATEAAKQIAKENLAPAAKEIGGIAKETASSMASVAGQGAKAAKEAGTAAVTSVINQALNRR